MDRTERAIEALERAKGFGLCVEFKSGLAFLKRTATSDPAIQDAFMEKLGKFTPEIHDLAEKEWIFAQGKDLVGQRVWHHERGAEGTVTYVGNDGKLTVSFEETNVRHSVETSHTTQIESRPNELLVLVDETSGPDEAASSQSQTEPKPQGSITKFLSEIIGR